MAKPRHNFAARDYTVEALKSGRISEADIRAEYQRMRQLAENRLATFERQGLTESTAYRTYGAGWVGLHDIPKAKNNGNRLPADLVYGLADLHKFLNSPRGTAAGEKRARKNEIATLRQHGYDFVTTQNYDAWKAYMREATNSGMKRAYGSDRVAELFSELAARTNDPAQVAAHRRAFEKFEETGKIDKRMLRERKQPKKRKRKGKDEQ